MKVKKKKRNVEDCGLRVWVVVLRVWGAGFRGWGSGRPAGVT